MILDTKMGSDPFKGFFYSLGGILLVSTSYITAKYGMAGFNPNTFALIWSSAAALYAFVIVLATGHNHLFLPSFGSVVRVTCMGLAAGASMILAWQGLSRLDPSFASFIWRFQPVLTIMVGILLLGEKLLLKEVFAITIMVSGGCISTIGRWDIVGVGTVITIFACVTVTIQMLIAKKESDTVHPNALTFYRVFIAAGAIALYNFFAGDSDFHVESSYWLVTLIGAFLAPCASFLLTFRAYKYWELSRVNMLKTTQPLFVVPMAYLVFGKIPGGSTLIGGLLILIGALWLSWIHLEI